MKWWDDLWLNESFATFASVLCQAEATEYTSAWTTFANVEKSWAYRQDQLPSTHPVAADIPDIAAVEVNFDGITYAKGASVLKQLVAYVASRTSSPVSAITSPRTASVTRRSPIFLPHWRSPRAATCQTGVGSGSRPPASTCCARTSSSTTRAHSPGSPSCRTVRSRVPVRRQLVKGGRDEGAPAAGWHL